MFGADGWIAELGAVVGWELGFQRHVLPGRMPADLDGTPMAVMARLGVGDALIRRYPGMVDYHAPWHESHEVDLMLRGRLDVARGGGLARRPGARLAAAARQRGAAGGGRRRGWTRARCRRTSTT